MKASFALSRTLSNHISRSPKSWRGTAIEVNNRLNLISRQLMSNTIGTGSAWKYPAARRDETAADVFHGDVTVHDPYRWLEDPDSKETSDFVDGQNAVSSAYIQSYTKSAELRSAIEAVFKYEKFSSPRQKGDGYWYWSYNPALLNQSQIWRSKSIDRKNAELFFDPNVLSDDGTVSLGSTAFSKDGKLMAYSISKSGSDNQIIYVKDTASNDTLERLSDEVSYVKFSGISWTKDNAGFVYHRYPVKDNTGRGTAADIDSYLCYHKIGTPQAEDIVLHKDASNPSHMFGGEISDDGRYLIVTTSQGTEHTNKLAIVDLGDSLAIKADLKQVEIVDDFHASFDYITNYESTFVFQTNENAPRGKLVTLDFTDLKAGFKELIPESSDVLNSVVPYNNSKLICTYTHDVKEEVSIYSGSTGEMEQKLKLPLGLAVYGTVCNHDSTDGFFIAVGGFTSPMSLYRYDAETKDISVYRETEVKGVNPADFETEQVFYPSKDGTKIPMFITGRKGLPKDGSTPCLQYGYGGFEISVGPSFSPLFIVLMKHFNARVVVANIRGGGEYGQTWWKAAIRMNRQNAFDDFEYGAKYLAQNGYTSPKKLAIYGGSNGGLLVGACLNQAPELFGATMAAVPVLDMLRFFRFTIGSAWASDYGNPLDSREMFEYLRGYSPLHNISDEKQYPATLLMTADHDDRVVPAHSLKFMAQLHHQKGVTNEKPLMIRVEKKAGHVSRLDSFE